MVVDRARGRVTWAMEVKWSDRFASGRAPLTGLLRFAEANPEVRELGATTRTLWSTRADPPIEHTPSAWQVYLVGLDLVRAEACRRAGPVTALQAT